MLRGATLALCGGLAALAGLAAADPPSPQPRRSAPQLRTRPTPPLTMVPPGPGSAGTILRLDPTRTLLEHYPIVVAAPQDMAAFPMVIAGPELSRFPIQVIRPQAPPAPSTEKKPLVTPQP